METRSTLPGGRQAVFSSADAPVHAADGGADAPGPATAQPAAGQREKVSIKKGPPPPPFAKDRTSPSGWVLRLALVFLTRVLYRIQLEGRRHVPDQGGALLVANHLSFVDGLYIMASLDRPVRFLMSKEMFERPWVRPLAKLLRIIPISSEAEPRDLVHALRAASEAIGHGELVCIFPEGQVTRTGLMLPFHRGLERIMKGLEAPIIPVCLDRVWGSLFSNEGGRFLWKWPRRLPYPVTVAYGAPLPPNTTHGAIRQAIQELSAAVWAYRKAEMKPLGRAFVQTARRHPLRLAMGDARVRRLHFGAALMRTIFLARRLGPVWAGQEKVGILLPPSVAGALVNFAALLMGKVPVNLNYTASSEILAACAQQCEIKTVITSQAFLDKIKVIVPGRAVLLEALAQNPSRKEKLTALAMSWLLPLSRLERALGRTQAGTVDDLATIIFSSGSTGIPKGVMLSHYNVLSNIEQLNQAFVMGARDRFLGILPFFHSFGFTVTLCLPAVLGLGVAFHPTPLDGAVVGRLVREYAITFLLTTPTFLQLYLRTCEPADFGSLRFVVAGAEKLADRLAATFEDQFAIRPLEGYGCTECSPVVAANTHDYRAPGFCQIGGKRGRIGHPLPGVAVRLVDPASGQLVAEGQPGLLLVKGPNVMQGYLGRPEETNQVLVDGWYQSGDMALMDEDGFLQITGRLSRFSKIGGEMVPHSRVEELLHELIHANEQLFVVSAVADEKKGERLVVLHRLDEQTLQTCLERLAQAELPNLWKPKRDAFHRVEGFPYLGSGKLDLRRVKTLAEESASSSKPV